ncbi:MAG: glutamine--fructose-6-phosphate transaminase (isomerizing) [Candidatus Geothermarchaeota archaeon]
MCGIIGAILANDVVGDKIYIGLKRLEYRGYDSAGLAYIKNGSIVVKKDAGKIDEIDSKLNLRNVPSYISIGHTRWATHGAPTTINAHPHLDCKGIIAVIHNGIIENFQSLKEELENKGHIFVSRTDTEVIPHLIEEEIKKGLGLVDATVAAVKRLNGSFALAIISSLEPDKIICVRNESPLIIGVGDDGMYCASDIPALLPFTRRVIPLKDGELAILRPTTYEIRRINDFSLVKRSPMIVEWTLEQAEKQGYPHYMLKEIFEQPTSLRDALRLQERYLDLLSVLLDRGKKVFIVAAGTSYHAALAGSYMFSKLAKLNAYPVIASEFIENYGDVVDIDTVVLALSQSGETYDTLKAVEYARLKAATVLGITNVLGSTLTRVARAYILQQSGPEIGVAATKTFTSQLIILAQLALRLAKIRGKVSQEEIDELIEGLRKIPSIVKYVLDSSNNVVKNLADSYYNKNLFVFIGRGINIATALEGRLKLLEISYIPSLAFPAGESKHGPIAIIEEGVPVIAIAPNDGTRKSMIGSISEMKARGAVIISLCEEGDKEIIELSDEYIPMPKNIPELLTPIVYIVPLQLLAYYIAVNRGLDPDKPRNLAKSVTVP